MRLAKRMSALILRHQKEIVRDPISLVFLYGLPLIMEILFYFLFASKTDQFKMAYLAPAMVGFSNVFLSLFLGILMAVDRGSAFMTRLYTTEVKPWEYILSYALAVFPFGLSQTVLLLVVGGIIDPSFWGVGFLYALLASMLVIAFFIAVGLFLGTVCNEKSVGGVASVIITGQSILSGMWFPLDGMSQGFLIFLRVLPFRNASLLIQNVFFPPTFESVGEPVLILTAYTVVVGVLAMLLFRKKMKE